MANKETDKKSLKTIETELRKIDKNLFKVNFFVFDTKGTPNDSLAYIYETALCLKNLGYSVQMIHAEKEFVGVEEWLGEKYSKLPHYNIEKDAISVSPADILFIPEGCSDVMSQTKNLPCKRVAILQNFNYLTESVPFGASWDTLRIRECVTTTGELEKKIKAVFPYVQTHLVRPCVPNEFSADTEPKQLIVNIVTKDTTAANSILKPFLWKYPIYSWVAFRPLNNLPREEFAKCLKNSAITIWCDETTDFGEEALYAMACGNIVIGKIPESTPEWMLENDTLRNNGVWCYNLSDMVDILANVLQSFLVDNVPSELYEEANKTVSPYTPANFEFDIKKAYVEGIFEEHKKELLTVKDMIENNLNKTNTENE